MVAFPDIAVIHAHNPEPAAVTGLFGRATESDCDILITGADGLAWFGESVRASDMVFALWPEPSAPVFIYSDAEGDRLTDQLRHGIVVLVAGGGLGRSDLSVALQRLEAPGAATEVFGLERLILVPEAADRAAARLCGQPEVGAAMLQMIGATVTILARPGTSLANEIGPHVEAAYTHTDQADGPSVFARAAWTRGLRTFQLRTSTTIPDLDAALSGSLGPTATLAGQQDARPAAAALFNGDVEFDIVAAADPGGPTTPLSDLAAAFGGSGPVMFTGPAVPSSPTVILRGDAAAAARNRLAIGTQPNGSPIAPGPGEDRERYDAHQWAGAQRRAALAARPDSPHGGATLVSEAQAIGIDPHFIGADSRGAVDFGTVAAISRARGWHPIDPSIRPVLDDALAAARRQISGDGAAVKQSILDPLKRYGAQPGFWPDLLSATVTLDQGALVFPYPAAAVELLRAVVAADGDSAELRRLIGPVKVAILSAFGGEV